MKRGLSSRQIWLQPLFYNVLSCIGLVAALLSDSWGDWLAWLTLGLPVFAMMFYWHKKADFK